MPSPKSKPRLQPTFQQGILLGCVPVEREAELRAAWGLAPVGRRRGRPPLPADPVWGERTKATLSLPEGLLSYCDDKGLSRNDLIVHLLKEYILLSDPDGWRERAHRAALRAAEDDLHAAQSRERDMHDYLRGVDNDKGWLAAARKRTREARAALDALRAARPPPRTP